MEATQVDIRQTYEALQTELRINKIGGLFLALYDIEAMPEMVITRLERDLPEQFHFRLHMDEQKVAFPIFFRYTFEEIGKQSAIFHVLGIEDLPESSISDFLSYLQLQRDNLEDKRYTLVFWISPHLEKRLFDTAPDFHHWVFGTYDFRGAEQWQEFLTDGVEPVQAEVVSLQNIDDYYNKVIWQYEHWQEVKDSGEAFLIEVMERADLHSYYVPSHCTDAGGQVRLLDDLVDDFLVDNTKTFQTLLGDFGTGKSSFAIHYFIHQARRYLQDKSVRMPLFVSLKNYPGRLHIEDFIVQEFNEKYGITLSFTIFQNLALQGRFLFLVDGFDEMASLADAELTIQNLKELTKLSFENILFMTKKAGAPYQANKILLTSRTHYFLTEA